MSDPIVGIDLGTSNSVVAYAEATGSVRVLADEAGYKIHPSVVSFHPSGGVVVGAAAKQRKVIDPKNTIYSVKRLIGRSFSSPEVQTARQRSPFQIKEGPNQQPIIVTRGGEFAVPEVSAIVLDHVRNVAAAQLQTDVNRAVVTVPASFNDAQRSATATAGAISGLTIVRVLNEPTAAALAYGHTRNLREIIAVYDFGGGTFDITVLKLGDQVYEVLGTSGDTFLGGDDLDERLVDRMVEKFLDENRVDLRDNEVSMMRLRAVAEQTKIELSRRSRAVVRVDEIAYGPKGKPLDLQIEITRDEFVRQVADIIDRTFPVCAEALKVAGLDTDQIDDVILVGGTTKIPYVRDQVSKFFAKAPRTDVNPEDAVAIGAALQATALERILSRRSPSRQLTTTDEPTDASMTLPAAQNPVAGVFDVAIADVEEPTSETTQPRQRRTAEYSQPPKDARSPDRPAERGQHHDKFEERTPPTGARPPTTTQPIGRLAKPPSEPRRTALGVPVAEPPPPPPTPPAPVGRPAAAPPPTPIRTDRSVPVQRAPAPPPPQVPVAAPQAPTLMLDLELEPEPASTARGIGPMPGDTDVGFSPLPTSRGMAPGDPTAATTAPGFVPPQSYPIGQSPVVMDVTPRGLGIGTVAGYCEELIRRNSRVPAEIRKLFTTSRDSQDVVRIIVCQGESRRLGDNVVIGDLVLENLQPRPRGETSIEVTFQLDASGILQVRARDAQTGKDARVTLDVIGSMPEAAVAASRDRVQSLRR